MGALKLVYRGVIVEKVITEDNYATRFKVITKNEIGKHEYINLPIDEYYKEECKVGNTIQKYSTGNMLWANEIEYVFSAKGL